MPVVDLFCGCGGLSKGFELAGFNIAAAYDSWPAAIMCYNRNFNHEAHQLDLNNVEESVQTIQGLEENIDVIIGGPPCQEFSNAGLRQEGARADLTVRYAEIITQVMPQFFVMENVPRARHSNAYAIARELYVDHGYGLTEIVLDASKCGVPQARKRFFCIGALGAENGFLIERLAYAYGDEETSIQDYFAAHNIELAIENFYRHPTTYTRRAIFPVDEPSPTIRGVNRPRPDTYRRHEKDSVPEEDIGEVRALTLRERAYIQTFPADYHFEDLPLSNGDLEQMVGNAVPVLLAQFVATQLINYINEVALPMDEKREFIEWLHNVQGYESPRSISDVISRIGRAERILPGRELNRYFITDLEDTEEFNQLSVSVKSQIRKAINLKIAFSHRNDQHG